MIFRFLLFLALSSSVAMAEFSETITISLVSIDDGIGEMLTGDLAALGDEGRRKLSLGPMNYDWRRLANMNVYGHSNVCDKCDADLTCDSEDNHTANLLETWLRDNHGYVCGCSTTRSTAVGKPGWTKTCDSCIGGCNCRCECKSYCDYELSCSCL